MIIACPACATRYVVPDSAIGVEGRTVRCAKCKHSWFQDGPDIARPEADAKQAEARPFVGEAPPPAPPPTPSPTPSPKPAVPAPAASDPASDDQAAAPAVQSDVHEDDAERDPSSDRFATGPSFDEGDPPYGELPDAPPRPAVYDDTVSQFDYSPPFRPRRNYVKLWTWAAGIFAVLALGTVVAANTFGLPSWMPVDRPLFAVAEPDLELEFPVEEQERRTLPNGTEYFGARIIVTNTARETRSVPPILIVLRDGRERVVFSWEVTPPKASLAPGESMTINEATTDVPKSAVIAEVGWAPR
ncbi:MAG: thioredoxin [Erythrobacter sp.]|nr:thioredoxin [Erythrobacter sp.]